MKIGKPEGDQIIYVGQHRQEKPYTPGAGVYICPCGYSCFTTAQVDEHWRAGHWDLPIYASLRELIQAGWEPKK
jgi:hypothetical protein